MLIERKVAQNDIKLFIGADTPVTITTRDRNGELVDLNTIRTIYGQARSKSNSADQVDLPIKVLDQKTDLGKFVLDFAKDFSEQFRSDVALKQLQYDIWFETFLNKRVPIQSGNLLFVPVITQFKK